MAYSFDVIVIGSGFGGAITSCRLAEKNQKVLVLERGRRWMPSEFPRAPEDPWLYDHNEPQKCNGWLDFRFLEGMIVAQGAGVGGGTPAGPPGPVMQELTQLRARLARNPNDLAALVQLANMEYDAQKFDKAGALYVRALALDPTNPDVRTDYATALHRGGRDLDALKQLDLVLRERPEFHAAVFNRGVVPAIPASAVRAVERRKRARPWLPPTVSAQAWRGALSRGCQRRFARPAASGWASSRSIAAQSARSAWSRRACEPT